MQTDEDDAREPKIVVGLDGSAQSHAALRWALDEARLRGGEVDVIHAWTYPYLGGWYEARPGPALDAEVLHAIESDAREMIDVALAEVGRHEGVVVNRVAAEGSPSAVLIAAANDADLLVVGSRGRGGFAELLLGSVSHQCAQHAPCPVVIVREYPSASER
jgi:nucleotide-binding universal stress UspA family protein